MATARQLEQIVGKALLDRAYRAQLLSDPVGATQTLRITLTDREIEYIKSLDANTLNALAEQLRKAVVPDAEAQNILFW